jgi:hypothetical protein
VYAHPKLGTMVGMGTHRLYHKLLLAACCLLCCQAKLSKLAARLEELQQCKQQGAETLKQLQAALAASRASLRKANQQEGLTAQQREEAEVGTDMVQWW